MSRTASARSSPRTRAAGSSGSRTCCSTARPGRPTYYCYLEDLFVDIDTRRTGTGRALIEAVYREADRLGATRTYWATKEDNRTARRLYDRLATLSPFVQYRR